jgi:hypothetical protein
MTVLMKRKPFLWFIPIVLFPCLLSGCEGPKITGLKTDQIDTSQYPFQKLYRCDESFIGEVKKGHFTIIPAAEYDI